MFRFSKKDPTLYNIEPAGVKTPGPRTVPSPRGRLGRRRIPPAQRPPPPPPSSSPRRRPFASAGQSSERIRRRQGLWRARAAQLRAGARAAAAAAARRSSARAVRALGRGEGGDSRGGVVTRPVLRPSVSARGVRPPNRAERLVGGSTPTDRAEPSTAANIDIDSGGDHGGRDPGAKRRRGDGSNGDEAHDVFQRPAKHRILAWRVHQYRSLVANAKVTARRARIRAVRKRTGAWKSVQRQLARATLSCDGLHRWSPCRGGGAASKSQIRWLHRQDSHLVRSEIFDLLLFGRDP